MLLDWKTSTQTLLVPVHLSIPSQAPPFKAPVQVVDDDANPSAGQVAAEPVQVSATSHWPAEVRHVWPEARNWQVEVQHEVAAPFEPARSHCSRPPVVSVFPSPQVEK